MHPSSIKGLDSLRFLAFLMVFIAHSFKGFEIGLTGVLFFYVISSFLLTWLALKEIDKTGSFSRKNFFVRRALRIYPLYYLIIFLSFFALPYIAKSFGFAVTLPEQKWMYWLLISNYETSKHVFFLKMLWSISVEEQFYLAFIFLSFFFKRFFFQLCGALTLIYFIYSAIAINGYISNHYFNPLSYLPCFICGMILAKIYHSHPSGLKSLFFWFILIGASFYIAPLFYPPLSYLQNISVACTYAIPILLIIFYQNKLSSYKNNMLLVFDSLGKMTYGLYVYGGIVLTFCLIVLKLEQGPSLFFIGFLILLPIAFLSYRFYEIPFLKLKEKFRSKT